MNVLIQVIAADSIIEMSWSVSTGLCSTVQLDRFAAAISWLEVSPLMSTKETVEFLLRWFTTKFSPTTSATQ